MKKLERFDRDIIKYATYYEVLDYVADYVQRFLKMLHGEEIQIPVPVDSLLEKLEISVELSSLQNAKDLASIHFNGHPCIVISKTVKNLSSNQANWLKLKCLAKYIVNIGNTRERTRSELILPLTNNDEILSEILAYELMLPCQQSIKYLLENNFFKNLNNKYLWNSYDNVAIGTCIRMNYPEDKKMGVYYHFVQTLEAKAFLKKIDAKQYEEFQNALWNFIEKDFEIPQAMDVANKEFIGYNSYNVMLT